MTITAVIYFKFRLLTREEEEKTKHDWEETKRQIPPGTKILSINDHAWGTEYNGFLVVESENFEKFLAFWKWFKDKVRWYVEDTKTVIGTKRREE
ncbi:MAG: hypothetical protein ACP6IP_06550 [Candidatus Njordarchaeia archaeon]